MASKGKTVSSTSEREHWRHHQSWGKENTNQEVARLLPNRTAYTKWRKAKEKPTDYPNDFNRFKRNIDSFGDGRNQSVRIAHAKMVESERKANEKANREPPVGEGITWIDVRAALLTSKELRALREKPKERKIVYKGTKKEIILPKVSPVKQAPPKEPIISTKEEIQELTPEGLKLPSAKKKKTETRGRKPKEWTIGSSATAQVFNKMLKESSNLGDRYICLSSYNVGDKILKGDSELNVKGVLELSENLLQFQKKKSAQLSEFLNALALKAPKSAMLDGVVEIAKNGDIQTIEFDPKIAETYFDLKDLTGQLKKVQNLQEICTHYSDLHSKKGTLTKNQLDKEKEMLEGLKITKPADLKKLMLEHEEAFKTAQAQIDTLEKDLKLKQKEAKKAQKTLKMEEGKSDLIKAQALVKQVENEWTSISAQNLSVIQSEMSKTIKNIGKDDKDRERKIQEAIDDAYGEIKSLAPNIIALAEKDKQAWNLWDLLEPEEKRHVQIGKITGGKLKKEGLLTNFRTNKSRADKFFKYYKGDFDQFQSEVKEAILSPHSGVGKIIEPVKKLKEKKKKKAQDKIARKKLKSISDIVSDLRKDMGLDKRKAKGNPDLDKYATNIKDLLQSKDFNTTSIPIKTMSQLIADQYKVMSK